MKRTIRLLGLLFLNVSTYAAGHNGLAVSVFTAKDVNAYVLSDGEKTLIVDATRSSSDAKDLAAFALSKGPAPSVILVTHGHPDHYLGLGALKKEFPKAEILVADEKIKEDIIASAAFMESGGWLNGEPSMKAKSESNPGGFDYRGEIGVLDSRRITMSGGSVIEVDASFPITEAPHETVLFSKDLNALFASDLVYNQVHLWLGNGVTAEAVENWRNALRSLKSVYGPLKPKVYPGHGKAADAAIFDVDLGYIDALTTTIKGASSPEEAKAIMIKKYPGWASSDFILAQSIKFQKKISSR